MKIKIIGGQPHLKEKRRVAAYCRVSTEHEEQESSLENQMRKVLHETFLEKPWNPTMAVQRASDERGADLQECLCGSRRPQKRICGGLQ